MSDAKIDPVKPLQFSNGGGDYQLATGGDGSQQQQQPQQGHKCCGGCCDMRRAVIIVNLVNVVLLTLGLLSALATRKLANNGYAPDTDDDEFAAALEEFKNLPWPTLIALQTLKIVLSIVGIAGAFKFNHILVALSMASYVFDAIMALIGFNVAGLLYAASFAYPHGFFIKEVRAGTMTKENYPNEESSCCCV